MELAKKPVRFLCNADANTLRVSVPKTENHYLFYRGQPYLVKYVLDIEFFDASLGFRRVDESEQPVAPSESAEDIVDGVAPECEHCGEKECGCLGPERQPYSRSELQKMRKSDVRDILKGLAPERSSPVRKEAIITAVLEAQ